MAYKRQIDRLPIVPKDAKEFNVTCHYCIVGCGYKAYTWPTNKQGGTAPDQNKFGVDLGKQQKAETGAWYSPSMYNIVRQNGSEVNRLTPVMSPLLCIARPTRSKSKNFSDHGLRVTMLMASSASSRMRLRGLSISAKLR